MGFCTSFEGTFRVLGSPAKQGHPAKIIIKSMRKAILNLILGISISIIGNFREKLRHFVTEKLFTTENTEKDKILAKYKDQIPTPPFAKGGLGGIFYSLWLYVFFFLCVFVVIFSFSLCPLCLCGGFVCVLCAFAVKAFIRLTLRGYLG